MVIVVTCHCHMYHISKENAALILILGVNRPARTCPFTATIVWSNLQRRKPRMQRSLLRLASSPSATGVFRKASEIPPPPAGRPPLPRPGIKTYGWIMLAAVSTAVTYKWLSGLTAGAPPVTAMSAGTVLWLPPSPALSFPVSFTFGGGGGGGFARASGGGDGDMECRCVRTGLRSRGLAIACYPRATRGHPRVTVVPAGVIGIGVAWRW